ncbi:hypothetical protein FSP39_020883 [Pinctada imbricata]|uniref:Uncharacterized protein n=1 Tax=Pinctada imbricata TaxID=66713 RepID=A0AA89BU28_PINIB|nr:hypothetical protein FSP39_020883 [Pinctada imbricata]
MRQVRDKGGDLQQHQVAAPTAKPHNTQCKNTKQTSTERDANGTRNVNAQHRDIKHKGLHINQRDQRATGADLGRPSATTLLDYTSSSANISTQNNFSQNLSLFIGSQGMIKAPTYFRRVSATFSSVLAIVLLSRVPFSDTPLIRHHSSSHRSESSDSTPKEKQSSQTKPMSSSLKKAEAESLWGMFIADALAMPVHWYYNPSDIKSGYGGWLTGYTAPAKRHPSSILTLSAVDGSGRSGFHGKSKSVIGDVILHDKLKYWQSSDSSVHYHRGMKAGDSTLNSMMSLQILKTMQRVDPDHTMDPRELRGVVLEDYVKFMTTPGSHNDTYCESFHRAFFRDWIREDKRPTTANDLLQWCEERYHKASNRGGSDSQLVVIGALVPAIPWIIHNAHKSEAECSKATTEFIKLTHPEPSLVSYVDVYSRLLHGVLNGHDLKQEVMKVLSHSELGGPAKREMVLSILDKAHQYTAGSEERLRIYQGATGRLGSACYIQGALSSMLFLALEFADDVNAGLLTNANCGGENCHRGAALGALLGAAAANSGQNLSKNYKDGLGSAKTELIKVLDAISS